jgi:hypothetical protein
MKMILTVGAAALLLSACTTEHDRVAVGVGVGAPVAFDAYYDGYYGPYYDGYWGDDGYFYYSDNNHHWIRDENHHFRRESVDGFNHVVVHARPATP